MKSPGYARSSSEKRASKRTKLTTKLVRSAKPPTAKDGSVVSTEHRLTPSSPLPHICRTPDLALFLRLPPEVRKLIYEQVWYLSYCPYERRILSNDLAWIGPHFNAWVCFPKVVLHMDPFIRGEFMGELCRQFPLNITFEVKHGPHLFAGPVKSPSTLFLEHVRRCNIEWVVCRPTVFTRARSPRFHFDNEADLILLRTGLRKLIKALDTCSLLEELTFILRFCRFETENIILSTFHDIESMFSPGARQTLKKLTLLVAPWNIIIDVKEGRLRGRAGGCERIHDLKPVLSHAYVPKCHHCERIWKDGSSADLWGEEAEIGRQQIIPSTSHSVIRYPTTILQRGHALMFDEYTWDRSSFDSSLTGPLDGIRSIEWALTGLCSLVPTLLNQAFIQVTADITLALVTFMALLLLGTIITTILEISEPCLPALCAPTGSCTCAIAFVTVLTIEIALL